MIRLLVLFIWLMSCCNVYAMSPVFLYSAGESGGSAPGFSCDCSGAVTFCWTPSSTTADCSDGDTSASANGSVSIVSNKINVTANGDYYTFAISSGDLAAPEEGSFEANINVSTWVNNTAVFQFRNSTGHYIYLALTGGSSSDIEARMRVYDGTSTIVATASGNKSTGNDLRLRMQWRESGSPNMKVEICDADGANCDSTTDDTDFDWTSTDGEWLQIGEPLSAAGAYTEWNIKVYNAWQGW